jgi:hypothetical protein
MNLSQLVPDQDDLLILNFFSFLGLDPQKTQIFFILEIEKPAISTRFHIC